MNPSALRWHLRGNVYPPVTNPDAIEIIERTIREVEDKDPSELYVPEFACSAATMFDDLRLWLFVERT